LGRCGLDSSGSEMGPLVGCFKHGNKPSGSIEGGIFLKYLKYLGSQGGLFSMEFVISLGSDLKENTPHPSFKDQSVMFIRDQ
jgi:hypothetical protein